MGCSQSKASTDQVVERVSVETPAAEAPVPESIKATEPEPVVEAPPASADELPPAPASVPVEEAPKTAESVVEEPAVVEESPKTEPGEQVVAPAEEAIVEDAPKTEEKVSGAEPDEIPVKTEPEAPESEHVAEEKAPKSEPVVEAPVEEETSVEAPVEETIPVEEVTPVEEPKSEVIAAPISEVKPTTEGTLTFKAENVAFNEKGVAYYNLDGSDSSNPANDVHVSKRYSEFKALHVQLTQQLADNQDEKSLDLPALPKASILQGRKNKKMLDDRKTQFTALLNAIAAHPVASQSDVFKSFLA